MKYIFEHYHGTELVAIIAVGEFPDAAAAAEYAIKINADRVYEKPADKDVKIAYKKEIVA